MTNLTKLEFVALEISRENYMLWALDAELHLSTNSLRKIIKTRNKASVEENAKTIIFLRYHLHECLKLEYLIIKSPMSLWTKLKKRFNHQKVVFLPNARYD